MKVGIPRETLVGERRVAATPSTVKRLQKLGFDVAIEAGAGAAASYPDEQYEAAGAEIVDGAEALWAGVDAVLKINEPTADEVSLLPEGGTLFSLLRPAQNEELREQLAARKATVVALDAVPRISRAQKMDVLSSMANIAGYRAVLEAANVYGRFFGGQITAAGKTPPAKVLVIGAGVAGLSAIATARALGAEVRAFDTRSSVAEQIESLGASFLEVEIDEDGETSSGYSKVMSQAFIDAEMAPKLVLEEVVEAMRPGGVIVDLAAPAGGNCELTVPGETVVRHGVHIVGWRDLTSRLPTHASEFFGNNLCHLLDEMGGGEAYTVDLDNEAVRGAVVLHEGENLWPPPPIQVSAAPPKPAEPTAVAAPEPERKSPWGAVGGLLGALALTWLGLNAPSDFVSHFTVFVLACFIGWQVIWNVSHALHTPLMAVTNAISGIIIVGGLLQAGSGTFDLAAMLGAIAILVASINVVGGFWVTQRMLRMFRKE
jgi:NAD(P) transhydrogenase subunit alpha